MRKNYFFALFAAFMLFVAVPVNAQIETVLGFFGKWKFEAKVEVVDTEYANLVKNTCDVIIEKGPESFPAKMTGFGGSEIAINISSFDVAAQTLLFLNPNTNPMFSPLYMADETGKYPFGTPEGQWRDTYGSINFIYDSATGVLSYPDFTLVTVDNKECTAEVKVKVSDVKMTLVEAAEIVIPDISGEWKYTPYYTDSETFVQDFTMTLAPVGDDLKTWQATFDYEGFDNFTLDAKFDGNELIIPYKDLYLDAENKIRFGIAATKSTPENVFVKEGNFTFSYSSKTLMYQGDAIIIRQEAVDTVVVDSTTMEVEYKDVAPIVQRLRGGVIEREDPDAYNWEGTYTVTVGEKDVRYDVENVSFPAEFNIVVEKSMGKYYVTEFLGHKMADYWLSGFSLVPEADGKSAKIVLTDRSYFYTWNDSTILGDNVDCKLYYKLTDINYSAEPISITLNEDGTLTLGSFAVVMYGMRMDTYDAAWEEDKKIALFRELTVAGIEDVVVDNDVVEGIFDIQGRRIDEITAPGLYIVNGKKVLVK